MIGLIKRILHSFSREAAEKRRHDAMVRFLSQATDRAHLEQLENEWFKRYGYR